MASTTGVNGIHVLPETFTVTHMSQGFQHGLVSMFSFWGNDMSVDMVVNSVRHGPLGRGFKYSGFEGSLGCVRTCK